LSQTIFLSGRVAVIKDKGETQMIQHYELKQRQSLPLRSKVLFAKVKMQQFIDQCGKRHHLRT
jgi:hypothetical protein